jgi:hypothetical protein
MQKPIEDMTIDELLENLIDMGKRQFIYGCGLFPCSIEAIDRNEKRISDLCDEIRIRVKKGD